VIEQPEETMGRPGDAIVSTCAHKMVHYTILHCQLAWRGGAKHWGREPTVEVGAEVGAEVGLRWEGAQFPCTHPHFNHTVKVMARVRWTYIQVLLVYGSQMLE